MIRVHRAARFAALLTGVTLLLTSFAIGIPKTPISPGVVEAYHLGDCDVGEGGARPHQTGIEKDTSSFNAIGIKADINTSLSFRQCGDWSDGTLNRSYGMSREFVRLSPGSGSADYDEPNKRLEVGVARCFGNTGPFVTATAIHNGAGSIVDYCWTPLGTGGSNIWNPTQTSPVFYIAYGGCNGQGLEYEYIDDADFGQHEFKISRNTSPTRFEIFIDTVEVAELSVDHTAIECWITDDKRAVVGIEGENERDAFGVSSDKTLFTDTDYKNGGSSSFESWTHQADCFWEHNPPDDVYSCDDNHPGGVPADTFEVWSVPL